MHTARNYNFGPLQYAAKLEDLDFEVPYIKFPYKKGYVQGEAVWKRRVGKAVVTDCPRKHWRYKSGRSTIEKNSTIADLRKWVRKINS